MDEHLRDQPPPLTVRCSRSDARAPGDEQRLIGVATASPYHEDVDRDVGDEERRCDQRPSSSHSKSLAKVLASGGCFVIASRASSAQWRARRTSRCAFSILSSWLMARTTSPSTTARNRIIGSTSLASLKTCASLATRIRTAFTPPGRPNGESARQDSEWRTSLVILSADPIGDLEQNNVVARCANMARASAAGREATRVGEVLLLPRPYRVEVRSGLHLPPEHRIHSQRLEVVVRDRRTRTAAPHRRAIRIGRVGSRAGSKRERCRSSAPYSRKSRSSGRASSLKPL